MGKNVFNTLRATDLRDGMARIMDEERRFANRKIVKCQNPER
jgi:hypothetical protein